MKRGVLVFVAVLAVACSSESSTPTLPAGTWPANAWYDAGGLELSNCAVPSSAKQYNLNGVGGPPPSALPAGPCSTTTACFLLIATGPYCGDNSAGLEDSTCECIRDQWECKGLGSSGGVVTNTWCDGGPGTLDGG
jgi:hypothetical protein